MFGGLTRLIVLRPRPYARRVARALFQDGFDPAALDQLQALGALNPDGSIFRCLAARRLKPADAALALRLASRRYCETRAQADAFDRPGTPGRPAQSGREAYFMQLLDEATEVLRPTH